MGSFPFATNFNDYNDIRYSNAGALTIRMADYSGYGALTTDQYKSLAYEFDIWIKIYGSSTYESYKFTLYINNQCLSNALTHVTNAANIAYLFDAGNTNIASSTSWSQVTGSISACTLTRSITVWSDTDGDYTQPISSYSAITTTSGTN